MSRELPRVFGEAGDQMLHGLGGLSRDVYFGGGQCSDIRASQLSSAIHTL